MIQSALINRHQFLAQLQGICSEVSTAVKTIGLLVFDLQEFHRINAVYGFETGDKVLLEVTQRVENSSFKDSDLFRIGGDEFALILKDVRDPKLLTLAANKLVRVLVEPIAFEQKMLRIEPFIGIAADSGMEIDAERLFINAEKSLLETKKQNKYFLPFSPNDSALNYDWRFESLLHQAVAANELTLYYQPKIHVATRMPSHAEALARWLHPDLGLVSPLEFIPILEKTGGIKDMTKWAIHTALRELGEWPHVDQAHEYSVAVNVSSSVLENPEFLEVVRSAINIWGVDPSKLTLEVTEGALIQEEATSYQSLYKLKDLGLKISIDDFGTGYSCLSYFKRIPADELKIDQSFVKNIQHDIDDEHLTSVIIDLAHRFNMSVVAEGVEDKETYLRLKEFGCDYVQGFYFSKPLPQKKYCDWLQTYNPDDLNWLEGK